MEKYFNWISIVLGLIGGIAVKLLGGWDILLRTIVVFVVLDYITGIIKGVHNKDLSSEIGYKGILKKVMIFIMIAATYALQHIIGDAIPLREIVIMFFIANEGLSLIENAAVLIPIPPKLKEVLLQIRDKGKEEK